MHKKQTTWRSIPANFKTSRTIVPRGVSTQHVLGQAGKKVATVGAAATHATRLRQAMVAGFGRLHSTLPATYTMETGSSEWRLLPAAPKHVDAATSPAPSTTHIDDDVCFIRAVSLQLLVGAPRAIFATACQESAAARLTAKSSSNTELSMDPRRERLLVSHLA